MKKDKLITCLKHMFNNSKTVREYSVSPHLMYFKFNEGEEIHSIINLFKECLEHLEGESDVKVPLDASENCCYCDPFNKYHKCICRVNNQSVPNSVVELGGYK